MKILSVSFLFQIDEKHLKEEKEEKNEPKRCNEKMPFFWFWTKRTHAFEIIIIVQSFENQRENIQRFVANMM